MCMPVSYTHLDVYKRQSPLTAGLIVFLKLYASLSVIAVPSFLNPARATANPIRVPVSYTHLDVYKRQTYRYVI